MEKIALIAIHGMGRTERNYADKLHDKLKNKLKAALIK